MKFWCGRPRGKAFAHCFKPHGGIVVRIVRPQRGAFAANNKCPGRDGHAWNSLSHYILHHIFQVGNSKRSFLPQKTTIKS